MSGNVEVKRAFDGKMHLFVAGVPAIGAQVTSVSNINGELGAVVFLPLKDIVLGEVDTVVPFPAARRQ